MGAVAASTIGSRIRKRMSRHATELHELVLSASRPRLVIPLSTNPERKSGHMLLGKFYEELHAGFWGGELSRDLLGDEYNPRAPDVIDPARRAVYERRMQSGFGVIKTTQRRVFSEVKGCFLRSQCQLRDGQIDFYDKLQASFPDWEVELAVYRHTVPSIKSYDGPEEDLIEALAKERTIYGFKLSYDIVKRMHNAKDLQKKRLVRIYKETDDTEPGRHKYETCTCLWASTMHKFVYEPESMLEKMGKDPADYDIERIWSPEKMVVQGHKVTQFPMISIRNKRYRDWAHDFSENYVPPEDDISDSVECDDEIERLRPLLRKQA